MQSKSKTHRSLEKALDLLQTFNPYNQELSTLELAGKMGMHRSTASRLLRVLQERGFLARNDDNKKYSLGPAISELAKSLNGSLNGRLVRVATPFLEALRNRIGQTVVLEQLSTDYTVITLVAEGPGPVFIKGTVGDRKPLHAAAGGKAILAYSPPEFIERILSKPLLSYNPNTITDPEQLRIQLAEINRRGFAFDREEVNLGIAAFGVPVMGSDSKPLAAVVVAGEARRVNWRERKAFVSSMLAAAKQVSDRLI